MASALYGPRVYEIDVNVAKLNVWPLLRIINPRRNGAGIRLLFTVNLELLSVLLVRIFRKEPHVLRELHSRLPIEALPERQLFANQRETCSARC